MFEQISEKFHALSARLRGQAHLTEANLEDILREIRVSMLEADVALPVVRDFINEVRTAALGQQVLKSLTPGQMFVGIFHQQLQKSLGGSIPHDGNTVGAAWTLRAAAPAVILMAGLQGVGKTTQSAKIAKWLRVQQKKKVLLVSCDTYRPAAMDQLRTLAAQIEVDCFTPETGDLQDPRKIAAAALAEAKRRLYDVLIVDTAGRLAVDEAMMVELRGLADTLTPHEIWLTIDAMQGQDALNTARVFAERVSITGLALTKADGDSRGGAILSARMVTGAPIRFAGISEKMDGLELFDARRMADRIMGMGDMVGLFEEAAQNVDKAELEKFAEKMKKGKGFDLSDFRAQLAQMRKMGGVDALLEKMPMQVQQMAQKVPQSFGDKDIRQSVGIIDSMTPRERMYPDLIKAARKKRIATGAGSTVQAVNKLLNQFEQMEKISKKMKGMGTLSKMLGGLGGGGMGGLGGLGKLAGIMGNNPNGHSFQKDS